MLVGDSRIFLIEIVASYIGKSLLTLWMESPTLSPDSRRMSAKWERVADNA